MTLEPPLSLAHSSYAALYLPLRLPSQPGSELLWSKDHGSVIFLVSAYNQVTDGPQALLKVSLLSECMNWALLYP